MPVMKKEFELDDGTKIMVRQASGLEKLKIENIQARVFRELRHFGADPTEWTAEQHQEFAETIDSAGGGIEDQIVQWIPNCILTEGFDVHTMTSAELRSLLAFVRGDEVDGAVPLDD